MGGRWSCWRWSVLPGSRTSARQSCRAACASAPLCRAMVHRPEVLILDEPFGALDAFTREDLWQVMMSLRDEESFTCLLITHDLRESVFLADKIVVLSARPAKVQHVVDVDLGSDRSIEMLYEPGAVAMLADLRHQIQIAQGRAA